MAGKRKTATRPFLDADQRRELWGLGLAGLGTLLFLSLIPVHAIEVTAGIFPTGNVVGVLGREYAGASWRILGVCFLLVPVFPVLWAVVAFGRLPRPRAVRLTLLVAALLLLVPPILHALSTPLGGDPAAAGSWGRFGGLAVAGVFGWVGAVVILGLLLVGACVASLGWNPLRSAAAAGNSVVRVVGAWRPRRRKGRRTPPPPRREPREPEPAVAEEPPAPAPPAPPAHTVEPEELPPMDGEGGALDSPPPPELLTAPPARNEAADRQALDALEETLEEKLRTFRIGGKVVDRTSGPVVTQFEFAPEAGIKVSRIANLDADLALALRAPSVRIVAPIPGKGAIGVEVPNPEPQTVYFREVLESDRFADSRANLPLALGQDIAGQPYVADLTRMPHLLIAGATGSGKSVCINTIITSLIYRHSPRTLRLLMVDPKMVELSMYNDLPHLRHPVVTDNEDAAGVLRWAVLEMERRYRLLSANGVRNLQDFNRKLDEDRELVSTEKDEDGAPLSYEEGPLPYIVLIIDELADLMMTVQSEVERPLALLAQKARAIGIHLILATQRPSVNVITGLIKANFPSRIAFRVSSKTDSRTILDQNGADSLLGNGDMLLMPPGESEPVRIQGAYLSTEDTDRLMRWYRQAAEGPADEEDDILDFVRAAADEDARGVAEDALEDRDELFREAAQICVQQQGGSTSLLQRRLRIGYGRAARIVDQLHHAGVLGPPEGSKPREVLIDLAQLDEI